MRVPKELVEGLLNGLRHSGVIAEGMLGPMITTFLKEAKRMKLGCTEEDAFLAPAKMTFKEKIQKKKGGGRDSVDEGTAA